MNSQEDGIRVYRDSWMPDYIGLLCGISNAGGGALVVSSASSSRAAGIRRLRKPFEQIPELALRELGIHCPTHPILDGPSLCLEIAVPAASPDHPTRYRGSYKFYEVDTDRNVTLSLNELKERARGVEPEDNSAPIKPPSGNSSNQPTLSSPDEIIQAISALMAQLAANTSGVSVQQTERGFFVELPHEKQAFDKYDLTSTDEFVLRVLQADKHATAMHIADLLGVSESTVRRSLKQLKDLKLIQRIGSKKAGYWRLLK